MYEPKFNKKEDSVAQQQPKVGFKPDAQGFQKGQGSIVKHGDKVKHG